MTAAFTSCEPTIYAGVGATSGPNVTVAQEQVATSYVGDWYALDTLPPHTSPSSSIRAPEAPTPAMLIIKNVTVSVTFNIYMNGRTHQESHYGAGY